MLPQAPMVLAACACAESTDVVIAPWKSWQCASERWSLKQGSTSCQALSLARGLRTCMLIAELSSLCLGT